MGGIPGYTEQQLQFYQSHIYLMLDVMAPLTFNMFIYLFK